MDNPFCVGTVAIGEGFVGRGEKLLEYQRKMFSNQRGSISLCGLPRVGKSSLVYNLLHECDRDPANCFIIAEVNIGKCKSFYHLWRHIAKQLRNNLEKNSRLDQPLDELINEMLTSNNDYEELTEAAESLFKELCDRKIKSIIFFDEFDYVDKVFRSTDSDETYYYFQFLRDLVTEPQYYVSLIIVSRRSLSALEDRCCGGSALHLAVDSQQLPAFSNDEQRQMRKLLEKYGVSLSDEEWEKAKYYAGHIPYLLSLICSELIACNGCGSNIEIIDNCYQRVLEYCKEVRHLLDDERYMKKMVQIFVGPKYDIIPQDVRELENRGYITVKDNNSIETICPFFEEYLMGLVRMEVSLNIHPLLTDTEQRLRMVIEEKQKEKYGQNWEQKMREEYEHRKLVDPYRYEYFVDFDKADKYIRRTKRLYNTSSGITTLSVISINELTNILEFYWNDLYASSFGNQAFSLWKEKFNLLALIRDPLAHSNLQYLTTTEISKGDVYCKEILEITNDVNLKKPIRSSMGIKQAEESAPTVGTTGVQRFINQEVTLINVEKTPRNGLRGILKGETTRATISPKYISNHNIDTDRFVGKEICVKIISWDSNAQTLNAELK